MTAGSRPAFFFRPEVGEVAHGQEGDELRAFGEAGPDGQPHFSLHARILQLVPGRLIVLAWKNMVWNYALDPSEITDLDSTVVLTFKKNLAGAEIQRCRRPMFLITKYVFLRQAKSAHSVQSSTRTGACSIGNL
jgi:uncharacterized protein YndB with AHSA1/START domain